MSKFDDIKNDFNEVLLQLDDRHADLEKFTLYENLASLTDVIKNLQRDVDSLKRSQQ